MNVLLTGGTGFVGKQVILGLLRTGHTVFSIIRNTRKGDKLLASIPTEHRGRFHIIEGDISLEDVGLSQDAIMTLKQNQIDAVYHMAAYLSFDPKDKDKTFHINVTGTKYLLELTKKISAKRFFHVSTAYTLGTEVYAKEELHSLDRSFVNFYEESKCQAEHLVFSYADQFDVSIFRPSIIMGDSKTGEADTSFALYGIIKSLKLLKRRMERSKQTYDQPFKLLCNKETHQNFVPVDFVSEVLIAGLKYAKKDQIYHLTTNNPPSNEALYMLVKEALGIQSLVLVPTTYDGELTSEEKLINEPLRIFHPYWERTIVFDNTNTQHLCKEAGIPPLNTDIDMLQRIISKSE
ncbi:SDR family NAD(P)-dependent oxidoreductase [Alkalihalobacterium elongatum]|uniref:SDR family NAD(P)-dependent oxidoreductase n=1 Tax=Alkalihalobacterium elongatum TaxID=2675466 RepID=UPI001C200C27|nr:SDR family NAD(P)-dependent oxidoreductase [Alkalihalobacterium elongatum]